MDAGKHPYGYLYNQCLWIYSLLEFTALVAFGAAEGG